MEFTRARIRNAVLFHTDGFTSKQHGIKAQTPELTKSLTEIREQLDEDQTLMIFNNEAWNYMMTAYENTIKNEIPSLKLSDVVRWIFVRSFFIVIGIIIGSFIWG
jgi:hypothetical protein